MGLFPYSTEAYFQCDCCWKAFPPSPEGPFRPGAAVVMGLEEAWSVSTSGAEQDGAPATHQPRRYCPASQRPTPGARQWRRCSKLSQEWSGFLTKIVHLAAQLFAAPPPPPRRRRPPPFSSKHRREIMKGKPSSRSNQKGCLSRTPFFSGSLSLSFKSEFPLFWY